MDAQSLHRTGHISLLSRPSLYLTLTAWSEIGTVPAILTVQVVRWLTRSPPGTMGLMPTYDYDELAGPSRNSVLRNR